VVDRNLRSWDHDNLYVVGAGSQVTIGTANPTLTAAALTIRAADAMLGALR
jgi:choline dehydrogenase-like flavoprotein